MVHHCPVPFVVGVGRSGTTLLRFMLDAHSDLCIPPETGFLPGAAALLGDDTNARERFFALVTGFKTWGDFAVDPARFRHALAAIEPFCVSAGVRAFYRTYADRHGKPRFGDKSPNYAIRLPAILAVLPEARFVHIIRDGRDVALSHRDVWFGKDKSIEELVDVWRRRIDITRQLAAECPHYLELRYEDLVRDSETELRRVCDFVELPYQPRMLQYFEGAPARLDEVAPWYNPDGSVRVTKEERLFNHRFTSFPPLESRVFRYQREMSDQLRLRCEAIAGPLLMQLGYETHQ